MRKVMLVEKGTIEAIATAADEPAPGTLLVVLGQTYRVHFTDRSGDDVWVYVSRHTGP